MKNLQLHHTFIDHIDRDKSNNRESNLRYATYSTNNLNKDPYIIKYRFVPPTMDETRLFCYYPSQRQ